MKHPAIGSYRDADGARHELVVRERADGGWQVLDLDIDAEAARLIETLAGEQDGRPQAEAIARDYLTTVGGFGPAAGPAGAEPIPEQGGSDARNHRRPHPAPRARRARAAALPRPAR
jgi:hypothetical protein